MKYTAYTFALSDFVSIGIACVCALVLFFLLGCLVVRAFQGIPVSDFAESPDNAVFDDGTTPPDISECGLAPHIPTLPAGSQLVEAGDGMITTPDQAFLFEYRWTGSQVEFVRRVPLSDFIRSAISHPDALAAQETFMRTTAGLR